MRIKKNNTPIIIGIIIIFAIILLIILNVISNKKKINYSKLSDEELDTVIANKIEDINKSELSNMGERDRMEHYLSEFITAVESGNYETAYQMLYSEFKENYFPSISDFEKYAKGTFPSIIALKNTNIERNGDIYVLWVTISNPLSGKASEKEMNFVIKENDLNDFELSFSVI